MPWVVLQETMRITEGEGELNPSKQHRILLARLWSGLSIETQTAPYSERGWRIVCNTFGLDLAQKHDIHHLGYHVADFDPRDSTAFAEFLSNDSEGFDILVCPPNVTGLTPDIVNSAMTMEKRRLRALACPNDALGHLKAIADAGIIDILKTPDVHRSAVAEYTLLQFGSSLRKLAKFGRETGEDNAFPHEAACTETRLLSGKTLGVVGVTGKDGSAVAALGTQLSMKVLGYSRSGRDAAGIVPYGVKMVDTLDTLLNQSDLISINIRLSPDTKGLIGPDQIACMKRGVVIVNPAGGELIDPEAVLADFLKPVSERIIASLTLDMPYGGKRDATAFAADPINARLKSLGVVFTPRMAGYAAEVIEDANRKLCDLLDDYIEERNIGETQRLYNVLRSAVVEAGKTAANLQRETRAYNYKQDGSPVSAIDQYSENKIRERLSRAGFTFVFSGEESGDISAVSSLTVIVDGIDGTRNYRDGNYGWCVSALVRRDGVDLCSVVYDPVCNVLYSAIEGRGAFIRVGDNQDIPLRVPTELPGDFSFSIGSFFIRESRTIKRTISEGIKDLGGRGREWGSIALSIVAVARGGLGAFVQGRSKTYDHGAAIFIAREAGASVYENEVQDGGSDILVCHPSLYERIHKIYRDAVT